MEFRIADTFTDSLAKLTGDEQKAVKTTAFDLQLDPAQPGMQFHKLDKAKDKNFWSVRVNSDIRLIVHKTNDNLLLCYVDHHDKAYHWAEKRRLETHPVTGAAQLVEIRETVKEVIVPVYKQVEQTASPQKTPTKLHFAHLGDADLLSYGVPVDWLADVRRADEDAFLDLYQHLPGEAAESLMLIATGSAPPAPPPPAAANADPFAHPDAQRRFRVMNDADELARALDYPWDKWTIFLHPAQRQLIERNYNGPARVAGSAGTGKTIVALHRAVYLTRSDPDARVLLATFSGTLANALRAKLRRLVSNEPRLAERLEVHSVKEIGRRLYELNCGPLRLASADAVRRLLAEAAAEAEEKPTHGLRFLLGEWDEVVDAWQLKTWEDYRDVTRLGRKTRLPEKQRRAAWSVFERLRAKLAERGLITEAEMFARVGAHLAATDRRPFDYAVVDEAQDVNPAQLRFLAALCGGRPNGLFFAGDSGQRIFQTAFSWKSLGVDVRGRSKTLTINYRTSHQIRTQADRLLGAEVSDVDGNVERRRGTVSVFDGPAPVIFIARTPDEEAAAVGEWLRRVTGEGVKPHEIGVFVRSTEELARARLAAEHAALDCEDLDERTETPPDCVSVSTMHLAKGLEFRAVAVMVCDDGVVPSQERIDQIADEADLDEVYETERNLLYVACTRARDYLLVSSGGAPSEFLDDLRPAADHPRGAST